MEKLKNQKLIKMSNIISILKLIRNEKEISRADIAVKLKLSPTTVSDLIQNLLKTNIIIEKREGESKGGRKPILLSVNSRRGCVVAVDIDVHSISAAVYDLNLNELSLVENVWDKKEYTNSEMSDLIIQVINDSMQKAGISIDIIFAIGIGIEGLIDDQKKVLLSSTVYPHIKNVNLFEIVRNSFNVPVYIENSSHLAAVAEKEFNPEYACKKNIIYLEVNEGVGEGIIINNNIFSGTFGGAGEIGHIPVDINGPVCKCGSRGCLEAVANTNAVLDYAKKYYNIDSFNKFDTNDICSGLSYIKNMAEKCEDAAIDIINKEAFYLSIGVLNIINTFNPEVIIIGGEITYLGSLLIDKIKYFIQKTVFSVYLDNIILEFSRSEGDIKLKGAAVLAVRRFFDKPSDVLDFD